MKLTEEAPDGSTWKAVRAKDSRELSSVMGEDEGLQGLWSVHVKSGDVIQTMGSTLSPRRGGSS